MNGDNISTQQIRQAYPSQHSTNIITKSRGYLQMIMIGIIIIMIGGIIFVSTGFLDTPDEPDYEDYNYNSEEYQQAVEKYEEDIEGTEDMKRIIPVIGNIFEYVGLMFLAIGLITGAIKDESLPANGRLGLLLAFGLVIGLKFITILLSYQISSPY